MTHFGSALPAVGDRVGRWTVEAPLGAGGHAAVYRAVDERGQRCALKVLSPEVGPEEHQRFARERDTLRALDHPAVVKLLDEGTLDGLPWAALSYVEGTDLAERIDWWRHHADRGGRYAEAERVTRALCEALDHVHARGFVHRDVKPANILLSSEGEVVLSDFGIVMDASHGQVTHQGRLLGTIAWMAPEIIAEDEVDARADLYGVGAVLYAMLTLERPVEADTVAGYLARHLTARPRSPSESKDDVPAHLERLCMRLLEKEPARRLPSARAVLDALDTPEGVLPALYGREAIVARWRARLADGDPGLFLISGPARSGRSTVMAHLAAMAREQGRPVHGPATSPSSGSVLVLDDLRALGASGRSILDEADHVGALVLAAVDESAATTLADRGAHIERHGLAPLSDRDLAALLRDQGVPTPVATSLGHRLVDLGSAWPGDALDQLEALQREGWLEPDGAVLRSTRPLAAFRGEPLPLPARREAEIREALSHLTGPTRELAELLALLERPASGALLARAATRPGSVPTALDQLLAAGVATAEASEDDLLLRLAHPGAAPLVLTGLSPSDRAARHLALARAFGRRHARHSTETARHLAAGGRVDEALPLFERFARRALAAGRARDAEAASQQALDALQRHPAPDPHWRARLLGLRGAAALARGRWLDAVSALQEARDVARDVDDPACRMEASVRLGQALYRLGRFAPAADVLDEILSSRDVPADDLARARRALADIHLQSGRLDVSMRLCHDALKDAERAGQTDDAARAHRGIAHVLAVEGRLEEAARELDTADTLLAHEGDVHVRAGIATRAIELDLCGGRYALALHRARALEDLLDTHGLTARLPESLAFGAVAMVALGDPDARAHAERALRLARLSRQSWPARFVATRLLQAMDALPPHEHDALAELDVHATALHRADAQRDALLARLGARTQPERARAALARAASRPEAVWSMSEVARQVDTAWAWSHLDEPGRAAGALSAAARRIPAQRGAGARFELALAAHAMGLPAAGGDLVQALQDVLDVTPATHRPRVRRRAGDAHA